jgi:FG-GAP-like repeat/FG-GAP repeat
MISVHSGFERKVPRGIRVRVNVIRGSLQRANLLQFIARLVTSGLAFCALTWSVQPVAARFVQQGLKLVAVDPIGNANQGYRTALSADGTTARVGGLDDNGSIGAAWIFVGNGPVWTEQTKLVASDFIGSPRQGSSVALSADGNTALVGGPLDNMGTGAAWVYIRSGTTWTEQAKLIGTGNTGLAALGYGVSLSADGNTALVGGAGDNNEIGAAWVFTRSGSTWTQQGEKLVGSGSSGMSEQGLEVGLSGDGNTAIVGGQVDSPNGAAWIFVRDNGVWTAQSGKLVGSGIAVNATFGSGVALSYDGNTAVIGGLTDNDGVGATWIFVRNGSTWNQQGQKLVGSGAVGLAFQGASVAVSADGNTAVVGGQDDNSNVGAAWVFGRINGNWLQQGAKLVGTSAVGASVQGKSVAMSANGLTLLVGGDDDNGNVGAAWAFIRLSTAHDFNGDTLSDIAWRDGSGDIAFWLMNGAVVSSTGGVGGVPSIWSIVGQRDFNGDGKADPLWLDTSGNIAMWFMNGAAVGSTAVVAKIPTNWSVAGVADFNGDGLGDILWRDTAGNYAVWFMNGATVMSSAGLGNVSPTTWSVVGTGDFNGDGVADILWRDTSGDISIWFMNGATVSSTAPVGQVPNWSVVGTGDFNGDGKSDIVWRGTAGDTAIWLMTGATISSAGGIGTIPTTWSIVQTGDYNGDGMSDLLWRDTSGNTAIWFMDGTTIASTAGVGNIPTTWTVQSANAE